jgi:hypothetical protein
MEAKRWVPLNALHGVISQKKILFKTTAVKTSNPTFVGMFMICLCIRFHMSDDSLVIGIIRKAKYRCLLPQDCFFMMLSVSQTV